MRKILLGFLFFCLVLIFGCIKKCPHELDCPNHKEELQYYHQKELKGNVPDKIVTVTIWEYRTDGVCTKEELTMPNIHLTYSLR